MYIRFRFYFWASVSAFRFRLRFFFWGGGRFGFRLLDFGFAFLVLHTPVCIVPWMWVCAVLTFRLWCSWRCQPVSSGTWTGPSFVFLVVVVVVVMCAWGWVVLFLVVWVLTSWASECLLLLLAMSAIIHVMQITAPSEWRLVCKMSVLTW